MVNEDIVTALRNAVNKGESLENAIRVMVNSGYNSQEVEEASHFVAGGVTRIVEPRHDEPKPEMLNRYTRPLPPPPVQPSSQLRPLQIPWENQPPVNSNSQLAMPQQNYQSTYSQTSSPNLPSQSYSPSSTNQSVQTNQMQEKKEKTKKKSYWIEIILFIILLLLIGVLVATVIYKDQILAVLSG